MKKPKEPDVIRDNVRRIVEVVAEQSDPRTRRSAMNAAVAKILAAYDALAAERVAAVRERDSAKVSAVWCAEQADKEATESLQLRAKLDAAEKAIDGWLYDEVDAQYDALYALCGEQPNGIIRCAVANLRNANRLLRNANTALTNTRSSSTAQGK